MKIIKTKDFEKAFVKLPTEIRQLYYNQEKYFLLNWADARLHTKKLKSLKYAYSFRVTRRYRVLFYFQNQTTAILFDIDHRKDVYE